MSKCNYADCTRRAKHYGLCYRHYLIEWKRKNGKERRQKTARGSETKEAQELRWAKKAYANAASAAARIDWRRRITELEKDIADGNLKARPAGLYGICEMCGADVELHEGHSQQAVICGEVCLRARLVALADDRDLGIGDFLEEYA